MGIAATGKFVYLETKPETETRKLWIQVFATKREITRVPPGRLSRTTNGIDFNNNVIRVF